MVTDPSKCLNINIGILGHVDSGKTSLGSLNSRHLHSDTASADHHHPSCSASPEYDALNKCSGQKSTKSGEPLGAAQKSLVIADADSPGPVSQPISLSVRCRNEASRLISVSLHLFAQSQSLFQVQPISLNFLRNSRAAENRQTQMTEY